MEVPFYATQRGGGKKREAREHTHTYARTRARPRVYCVHACARERCTAFAPGGNACTCRRNRESTGERRRRREKGGSEGDGSCVCTTRRVYQATSVVTAIVPTTSPAGRHPRSLSVYLPFRRALPSLRRRVGFPPPRSSSRSREPPWAPLPRLGGDPSYATRALLASLPGVSCLVSFLLPVLGATSVSTSGRKVNS